jgi:hypothetical protein
VVRTANIDLVPHPGDNQLPGKVRHMFHYDFVQYIVECAVGRLIVGWPLVNLLNEGALVDGFLLARAHGAAPGPRGGRGQSPWPPKAVARLRASLDA